jgi:hypothetical protein
MEGNTPVISLTRRRLADAVEAAVEGALEQRTVWGECDCVMWCANVVKGPLGYDPVASFRHRYTTPVGYLRVLNNMGYASLDEALQAVAMLNGWPKIDPYVALPGDVGITPHISGMRTMVLCWRSGFWVGHRNLGYGTVLGSQVELAYRIA